MLCDLPVDAEVAVDTIFFGSLKVSNIQAVKGHAKATGTLHTKRERLDTVGVRVRGQGRTRRARGWGSVWAKVKVKIGG